MGNSLIQRTGTSITHTGFHRRTGITLIALTATTAAPALSACSPSSPANEAETASTAQGASVLLPEGEGSTQYPLTLETPFGHTVLDKRPERVAVVSAVVVDTESLLALDAVPVLPWRSMTARIPGYRKTSGNRSSSPNRAMPEKKSLLKPLPHQNRKPAGL